MDILLTSSNTMFNNIIRKKTNSQWGHSSVIIDDIVYDFDYNEKSKLSLSSILSEPSIFRASSFYLDMWDKESEELYKELFNTGNYDIKALYKLRDKLPNKRDKENIQTSSGLYSCSSLIAKVCYENYKKIGLTPELLKNFHWSQIIPNDYANLDFKKDYLPHNTRNLKEDKND